jgi:hypothetical protein
MTLDYQGAQPDHAPRSQATSRESTVKVEFAEGVKVTVMDAQAFLGMIQPSAPPLVASVTITSVEFMQPNDHEAWLHENKAAYTAVCEGLAESARGAVKSLGSFAQYADLEID